MEITVEKGGPDEPPARARPCSRRRPPGLIGRSVEFFTSPMKVTPLVVRSPTVTVTCGSIARDFRRSVISAATWPVVRPTAGTEPA